VTRRASVPDETQPAGAAVPSERRRELMARLMAHCAANGLSDVPLRPLAAAVGSSPRVLLYFFGSKEGLIRAVLAESRAIQVDLVGQAADKSDADPIRTLWTWLTDPAQAQLERLFFESYARSLHNRTDSWQGFATASLNEWWPSIERIADREPAGERLRQLPTLLLATMRGLLLDLLATGDADRVHEAFEDLLDLLRDNPVPPAD
jgi:AcrR family transcriptional regulator